MKLFTRRLSAALVIFLSSCCLLAKPSDSDPAAEKLFHFDEAAVIERLKKLKSEITTPRYNTVVKSYLLTYTHRRRDAAERILGRSVMYFPIFEDYLAKHKLPADLKYLAVVESALDPDAVSRAGAVGLWQFMPETGRWMGLEVNSQVDERRDPHRSTEAAMRYLSLLYRQFGNWELAIAAYNSGGGRVSRAMKQARSKDFWKIQRFLPRETSNYVPAFIAATYLLHHYEEHDLTPDYPDLDLQLTNTLKVYGAFSFAEISQVTDLPLDVIEALNPSYRKGFIPESKEGRFLTLPLRVMPAFEGYMNAKRPDPAGNMPILSGPVIASRPAGQVNADYVRANVIVREGENLASLAQELNCTVHQIRAWNKLPRNNEIKPGQKLIIYHPKEYKRFQRMEKMEAPPPIPTIVFTPLESKMPLWAREQKSFVTKGGFLYYQLREAERVFDLAQKLPDVSIQEIIRLNGFKGPLEIIKAGAFVRVKKL